MDRTFLFEIENGATHWVIATSAVEALRIAVEHSAFEGIEPDDGFSVSHCQELRAAKLTFNDDGKLMTMWEAFQRDMSPKYLACSEF